MGCLNSTGKFEHWFGNIHLSGPCNRSCYFCIGQHMMSLDALNVLEKWPLEGIDRFVARCRLRGVTQVNLTGTNTDPLLYVPTRQLTEFLREKLPGVSLGIRTNGALASSRPTGWRRFDRASLSIHSLDPTIYQKMMGSGYPPHLGEIERLSDGMEVSINVVLGPENVDGRDLLRTLDTLAQWHFLRGVNLREPYGQPHVGDPLERWGFQPSGRRLGMPRYDYDGMDVTYWDVHYVEVESVNLYASGRLSEDYPITRGHDPLGDVRGQEHWTTSGRHQKQWLKKESIPWAE